MELCFISADWQMWMSVKCFLECVSMASASTRQAPSFASALQEWLLMSVAGCALVGTVNFCQCVTVLRSLCSLNGMFKCIYSIFSYWIVVKDVSVSSRSAYGAVLPDPWGWALWGSYPRKTPCGCLLLLSGCGLGTWVWWVSGERHSRVHPALSPWTWLLSQGWLHQRQALPQR